MLRSSDFEKRTTPLNKAKTRPNDPCWCGSGQKYKKCHRTLDQSSSATATVKREPSVLKGVVSPMRAVPETIQRPEYAASGRPRPSRGAHLLRDEDEARMREAGKAARRVLAHVLGAVQPGVTTDDLDAIAHEKYIDEGGYPSPLNYHGFPKSICTSVNEVICHGIPDSRRLQDGDIVNVDVTIYKDGMHGDCSETVVVGEAPPAIRKLVDVTRECMYRGIGAAKDGIRLCEIGRAIEEHATAHGYSVVRDFVGHGIGPTFHMDPQVPHYFDQRFRERLRKGMVFTVEPMINIGTWRHHLWDDHWTAVTQDLQLSAQFEHTILLTENGPEILTLAEEVEQPFLSKS